MPSLLIVLVNTRPFGASPRVKVTANIFLTIGIVDWVELTGGDLRPVGFLAIGQLGLFALAWGVVCRM